MGVGRKARVEWREEMRVARDWGMAVVVVCLSRQFCYDDPFLLEMVGYNFRICRTTCLPYLNYKSGKLPV
jgi:hypothetical protein